jgi:hypothetical protein
MGVLRLSQGPGGALYAGGLGAGGNWGQDGKLTYGLQKLTPNGLRLRHSNGPNPSAGTKTVSLYVNGVKVKQVALASTGGWETWAVSNDRVTLRAGGNTVAYKVDSGDIGHVNLDSVAVGEPPGDRTGTGTDGRCVDVSNAGTADGTPVQLWNRNGTTAQSWTRTGDTLRALGKCLDVSGGHLNAFVPPASPWPVSRGSMEVLGGDLRTKQAFGDFKPHVEFWLPNLPPEVTGQARDNSGIHLQDRYELRPPGQSRVSWCGNVSRAVVMPPSSSTWSSVSSRSCTWA